jgi:hypothetical protein
MSCLEIMLGNNCDIGSKRDVLKDNTDGSSPSVGRTLRVIPRPFPARLRSRLWSFQAGRMRSRVYRLRNRGMPCLYIVGSATSAVFAWGRSSSMNDSRRTKRGVGEIRMREESGER